MFTYPTYQDIQTLQATSSQYNDALSNSKKLQETRDALASTYSAINPDDLARLSKMLPDNADNIRLIIDIQRMAQAYGMSLSTIKFDANQTAQGAAGGTTVAATQSDLALSQKNYGVFNLEFTTSATYDNFLKFTKDLESSLRLTDIQSIDFSSDSAASTANPSSYTYTVKLNTYWLKS